MYYHIQGFDEKRRHPQPPNQAVGMLMQVMDLHWLSSYEFAATYVPQDPNSDEVFLAFISTPVRIHYLSLLTSTIFESSQFFNFFLFVFGPHFLKLFLCIIFLCRLTSHRATFVPIILMVSSIPVTKS